MNIYSLVLFSFIQHVHLRECDFVMKKINIILFTHAYTFSIIMKIQHDCTVVHELQNTQQATREGAT